MASGHSVRLKDGIPVKYALIDRSGDIIFDNVDLPGNLSTAWSTDGNNFTAGNGTTYLLLEHRLVKTPPLGPH